MVNLSYKVMQFKLGCASIPNTERHEQTPPFSVFPFSLNLYPSHES